VKNNMKESKRDKILSYLNMLPYYREKKEGVGRDYELRFIPRRGWIVLDNTFPLHGQPSVNFLGKDFASIERHAEKAIFAWQVFGMKSQLFQVERSND
jgi:hypothetical protein